jgi:hypothetical protein
MDHMPWPVYPNTTEELVEMRMIGFSALLPKDSEISLKRKGDMTIFVIE